MDKATRGTRLRRLAAAAAAADQAHRNKVTARDDDIEAADLEGWAVREIARETGLSPTRVDQIVAARTAARQYRAEQLAGLV